MQRAKNELDLAKAIFKLSTSSRLKMEFELKQDSTFFSNVICNSYYCIFYSAKALLRSRNIFTKPPEEHRKRGKFTYQKLPQANLRPAKESADNAEKFYRNISLIMKSRQQRPDEVKNENAGKG